MPHSRPEAPIQTYRPRPGLQCIGRDCRTLVLHARICEACLCSAAIELAQGFEKQLIANGFAPGSVDLKAQLAGYPVSLPLSWYRDQSELGEIAFTEAERLRNKTDAACFLIALGGVAALDKLPGADGVRSAVAAWTGEPADPPAKMRIELEPEEFLRSERIDLAASAFAAGERMDGFFRSLPRTNVSIAQQESRFQMSYGMVLALILLLLMFWPRQ